jgi:thymidylate synthase
MRIWGSEIMQTIAVFQQNGSGKAKIEGINRFGDTRFQVRIYDIDPDLPPLLDDTDGLLPQRIEADLVLDFLCHRDLSDDLSRICARQGIPVVASGRKILTGKAICPPT